MMTNPLRYGIPVWAAVFSIFIFSNSLFAQKTPFTGYYVGTAGDTIQGTFPDFRQWENNPGKVKFIQLSSGEPVTLTPTTCTRFQVTNYESYVPYSGKRLTNPTDLNQAMNGDSVEIFAEITTFLRVVFEHGGYRLLAFSDAKRNNFYIQENDGPAVELKCLVFLNERQHEGIASYRQPSTLSPLRSSGMLLGESATYRQQLVSIFNKQPGSFDINRLAEGTNYIEKDLVRFMKKATGYQASVTKKKEQLGSGIYITGGISVNTFRATGKKSEVPEAGAPFSTNVSPLIGVSAVIRKERNFGKLFLAPQLKFYRYKNQTIVSGPDSYTRRIIYQSNLVMNPALNVGYDLFRTRHLRGYIAPGFGLLVFSGNTQTTKYLSTAYRYHPVPTRDLVRKGIPISYNVNVQTGLVLNNKILMWASYAPPTNTMNLSYGCLHQTLQAGVGYRLLHK